MTKILNKKQYRVEKDNNSRITNTPLAITAVAITPTLKKKNIVEKGDDPLTMFRNHWESNGEGRTGPKSSFYYQQEHSAKSVENINNTLNDVGDTICTGDDMKVITKKVYLSFYNSTHQTCSVKSENCIFVTSKLSDYKGWSGILYKNIFIAICVQFVDNFWRKMRTLQLCVVPVN